MKAPDEIAVLHARTVRRFCQAAIGHGENTAVQDFLLAFAMVFALGGAFRQAGVQGSVR
ncbi:hypothetical protein ABAC402_18325 [Asticcacaulis sp. AC402]|nr:hypothetical protein ABAC402_18325 [Asticcacaulis sp. AC402]